MKRNWEAIELIKSVRSGDAMSDHKKYGQDWFESWFVVCLHLTESVLICCLNTNILLQENIFQNVVCKVLDIDYVQAPVC